MGNDCTVTYNQSMTSTISASVARQTLPAQLDLVEGGEEVAITRHGRIVAVLVNPEVLRTRRTSGAWLRADAIAALLSAARAEDVPAPSISPERAEALVAEIRADRDSR